MRLLDTKIEGNDVKVIAIVIDKSKSNQFKRAEHASFIRSLNPLLCPVGSIAFVLFYRWYFTDDRFPNLYNNSEWYDMLLLPGEKNICKKMDYSAHLLGVKTILKGCDIDTGKCFTHVPRKTAARLLNQKECSDEQVDMAGRWKHDKKNGSYLLNLPMEAMKLLAGGSKARGSYMVHRKAHTPPLELVQQVFPEIWQINRNELDKTALNFINLLEYLSVVLIQDVGCWMHIDESRGHKIFTHPLFACELFKKYSSDVFAYHSRMMALPSNDHTSISDISPDICQHLSTQHQMIETVIKESQEIKQQLYYVQQSLSTNIYSPYNHYQPIVPFMNLSNPVEQTNINYGNFHINHNSVPANMLPRSRTASYQSQTASTSNNDDDLSIFALNKETKDLVNFAAEYFKGSTLCPSYKQLEADYGPKWRKGKDQKETASNRQFWCKRLSVAKEIERVSSTTGNSIDTVVLMLVEYIKNAQKDQQNKKASLPWLIQYIKSNKNAGNRVYRINT